MRNGLKIFITAMVMFASGMYLWAQSSATANATAVINTAISIAKVTDMNFGVLSPSNTPGTAVLTPAGVRSATGGVTLAGGTVTAASFTVSGEPSMTYSITLPSSDYTIYYNTNSMVVNTFTSDPASTGTLSGGGTQTLSVGATLGVGAMQPEGTYTSEGGFTVTVNYN